MSRHTFAILFASMILSFTAVPPANAWPPKPEWVPDVKPPKLPPLPTPSNPFPGVQNEPPTFHGDAQPVASLGRGSFRYSTGTFIDHGNGQWTEQRDNGVSSRYVQVARTGSYYELFDQQRRLTVRLFGNKAMAQTANGSWAPWPGSAGSWAQGTQPRGQRR